MSKYQLSRDIQSRKNKYIDLKVNGRLFPSWILANFKKYKLPEIIKKGDEDPCNIKEGAGTESQELRKYQVFLSQYLDYKSPYRNILIYHGLGSGKTASAINIYNTMYNYTPGWNVIILIKASLKGSWLDELKTWLIKEEHEFRFKNIVFVHYDSPIADRNFTDAIKNLDSSKKSLYIIDEVHNFIRNVYSNVSSSGGKRAQNIYDYIIQDKRDNPDTRVVLLSGTPAINNPFELALLFNLLRPNIFPKSENEFNHQFISTTAYQTMSKNSKNMFQRRIMGLVSFYIGATPDLYATKTINYVDVPMSDYQQEIYTYYEEIEEKIAMKARLAGKTGSQMYKSYTRQACNFAFPQISQRINGENRPRPNKFRISEREAEKLNEGKEALKAEKDTEKFMNVQQYKKALDTFINSFDEHLQRSDAKDKSAGHTIITDVSTFLKKYEGNYEEFHKKEEKKSSLYKTMHVSSAKMLNIIFNIMKSMGPTIVYSNYVLMEGLEIFKIYLKYFGFYNFMKQKTPIKDKIGYVEFHGGIKDVKDRYKGMEAFNKSENKHGEIVKIMLISPAGTEGLNLKNVRQVHIMEPYWNEVRITQMIGRGIRQCSHKDLPMEQRHMDVYRYKSIRSKPVVGKHGEKWTTDQYIEDVARSKDSLIQSFLDAIKEVAVDCVLNKTHNALEQDFKCFQFEEPSLFAKHIGPAYKEDIYDDARFDSGSNSTKAITVKIKVMKINAVKQLTDPEEEATVIEYSKPEEYWYYPKSGVVYDYEFHYPIGKIAYDEDNLPSKIDKDTYVIQYVIPIPLIES
jgi:superfamily II DNA or RNA helicase